MAEAVNCTQTPGPARLSCLKAVPADAIQKWANGPQGLTFSFMVDKLVVYYPCYSIHPLIPNGTPALRSLPTRFNVFNKT